ncbi:hypothetical protein C9374_009898 [Naegleria lovaniensis]|uniref:mRNA export factor GLE1 n=1 Tax=Naegleria lovaniensis TaxID=51637 RepID=A0AA88KE48_NAELO|nr:uncharacterized protein C9374_009898 [Naegleria lovaniensis]KAG2375275.1 hypothetical protein C9374_009898 [Naegleria lovaniensis]
MFGSNAQPPLDVMDTQEPQHFESLRRGIFKTPIGNSSFKPYSTNSKLLLNHHRASIVGSTENKNSNVDIATELAVYDTITNNDVYNFKERTRLGPIGIFDEDDVMQDEIDQQQQQRFESSFCSSKKSTLSTSRPRVSRTTSSNTHFEKYYEIKRNIEKELLCKPSPKNNVKEQLQLSTWDQNIAMTSKKELQSKLQSAQKTVDSFLKDIEKEIQQERMRLAQSKPIQPPPSTEPPQVQPPSIPPQTTSNIQPTPVINVKPMVQPQPTISQPIVQPLIQQPSVQPTVNPPQIVKVPQPQVNAQPIVTPSTTTPQIVRVPQRPSTEPVSISQSKIQVPSQGTRTRAYMRAKFFMDKLDDMNAVVKQFENDKSFKSSRLDIKRSINGPFNRAADDEDAINNVKNDFFQAFNTFKQSQDPIPNGKFYYSLVLFANTLIENACSQATDLKKVFPYARITAQLMAIMPEVLYVVMGTIHSKCLFTIPYYPNAQSKDEFKKLYGFEEDEDESTFVRRMKEMIILYASIIQTDVIGHEYGLDKGWEWLAAVLNLQPVKYTIEMVDAFVKIAGHKLEQAYKLQFAKLLHYLEVHFIPNLPPNSDQGSITRLNLLITNYKKDKIIPPPIK